MNETSDLVKNEETKKKVPNPTGKGGFQERPEDINRSGTWDPKNTFSYQMNRFKNMTIKELKEWQENTPEDVRTVAEDLAFKRVFAAQGDLKEFQEVADRTEGKPKQPIEHDGKLQINARLIEEMVDQLIDEDEETEEDNEDINDLTDEKQNTQKENKEDQEAS